MFDDVALHLLEQIARELSGTDIVFPTSFDLTLRLQALLKNPDASIEQVAALIRAEPLMSTKVLAYANSAAVRGTGPEVADLGQAIMRIGLDAVRTVSYTLAVEQIIRSRHMLPLHDLSNAIWEHSLAVAALARLLAARQRMNPEKAFFLGMIHDIGAFYLLFRCSQEPRLAGDREALVEAVYQWHDGIGHALLAAMGQHEDILSAVQDHEAATTVSQLGNWTAILIGADLLAQRIADWVPPALRAASPRALAGTVLAADAQIDLVDQAEADMASLRAALF